MRYFGFGKLVLLLIPFTLIVFLGSCESSGGRVLVDGYYEADRLMWERLFAEKQPLVETNELQGGDVIGAVLPHHDLTMATISRMWNTLSSVTDPPVIVLVSPNHFEVGNSNIIVPHRVSFHTIDGLLVPDAALVSSLANAGAAEIDDSAWQTEHGIYAHVSFIKRFFPKALFLPIILRPGTSKPQIMHLVETLDKILPEGSLVVGSVDFSHYQIKTVADHHDLVSRSTISNFELDNLRNIEIDSPETLLAVMSFCGLRHSENAMLLHRSSTFDFVGDADGEITSHQYWVFSHGVAKPYQAASILIAGSMPPDYGLGLRRCWEWDRYAKSDDKAATSISNFAGKEARFLSGFDLYLFDVPVGFHEMQIHGLKACILVVNGQGSWARPEGDYDIRILVMQSGLTEPRANLLKAMKEGFNIALWRGKNDSVLAYRTGPGSKVSVLRLGSFIAPGTPISGRIAIADFVADFLSLDSYTYSSPGGFPPAIHQFTE